MFINFSIKPLRAFTTFGMFTAFFAVVLGLYFLTDKMLHPMVAVGWTSLVVSLLFFSGTQLIFLGLIGEYLGKLYLDVNGTPQWTIKREYNT